MYKYMHTSLIDTWGDSNSNEKFVIGTCYIHDVLRRQLDTCFVSAKECACANDDSAAPHIYARALA